MTINVHSDDSTIICEQPVISIRWMGEDPQVHEEFVGLYSVPQIDTWTIPTVITDNTSVITVGIVQVEPISEQLLKTMLQWSCRQHEWTENECC